MVSVKETCRLTSFSRSHVYTLISQGKLVSKRVGGRRLVLLASIEALGDVNAAGAAAATAQTRSAGVAVRCGKPAIRRRTKVEATRDG